MTRKIDAMHKYFGVAPGEHCKGVENGYPVADRKMVGSALRELFGVSSTTVRIDGVVKRIYICNVDGFDIDELGIRRKK